MCRSGNTVDTNVTSHIHSFSADTLTSEDSSEDYPRSKHRKKSVLQKMYLKKARSIQRLLLKLMLAEEVS